MSKALSFDLRVRVRAAVTAGASHRAAAARFGMSAASVSRWRRRASSQGDPRPRALGGDRRSSRIETHRALILGLVAEAPDMTIDELHRLVVGRGLGFGFGTIQRFLVRHGMTRKKKTAHASEQDRSDVLQRRQAWFDRQGELDLARLVFIDETWAKTNMMRTHGRAPRGERLRMGRPHGHWKTLTFVAELTPRGMIAPFVLDGPINRRAFKTYVEKVLAPDLRKGDIVVMDNPSCHNGAGVRERIEAAGVAARLLAAARWRAPFFLKVIPRRWKKRHTVLWETRRPCALSRWAAISASVMSGVSPEPPRPVPRSAASACRRLALSADSCPFGATRGPT